MNSTSGLDENNGIRLQTKRHQTKNKCSEIREQLYGCFLGFVLMAASLHKERTCLESLSIQPKLSFEKQKLDFQNQMEG